MTCSLQPVVAFAGESVRLYAVYRRRAGSRCAQGHGGLTLVNELDECYDAPCSCSSEPALRCVGSSVDMNDRLYTDIRATVSRTKEVGLSYPSFPISIDETSSIFCLQTVCGVVDPYCSFVCIGVSWLSRRRKSRNVDTALAWPGDGARVLLPYYSPGTVCRGVG